MLINLIEKIRKLLMSPYKYAKYIGVNIGENNFIPDKNTWSSEPYLITVGSHCQLTGGVRIFTHGGAQVARRSYPDFDVFGKVVIEDWCYIGTNALIMPGVTIGEGSLVAAGSIVTKSVPKGCVVGGNPAKIICSVDDYIKHNLKYNLNSKGISHEEKRKMLIALDDAKFIHRDMLK